MRVIVVTFWLCAMAYFFKGVNAELEAECSTVVTTSQEVESCISRSWYWIWK